jgi:outer membrane protein, multidrug efflux system
VAIDLSFGASPQATWCWRALGLLPCLVGLAACTLGPNYQRPDVAAPPQWSAEAQQSYGADLPSRVTTDPADITAWWKTFGDARLDQLIQTAREQNLGLQQAALRIAESRAQRDTSAAALYPKASGSGDAIRARTSPNGISKALSGNQPSGGTPPPSTFNLFQVGFDASWELDLFGKTRRSVEAADAEVRSSQSAQADALISMTAEIVRVYFTLRGDQRRRDIALADVRTEERLQTLIASRNRSGLAPESDVAAQEVEVATARASLPQLNESIAQNVNRLSLLLALPPGSSLDLRATAPLPALPQVVPAGLPADIIRRRPDVRQREAELAAATARIGVARAAFFPSVTLGLTGGQQSTLASQLLDWSSRFLIGGGQVSVPIFSGGKLKAQLRLADLKSQEAALAYREAVLTAFHEVDNALIAYVADQQRAADVHQQLRGALRSRDLAEERYQTGLAAYITVLDAQRKANQAEENLAEVTVLTAVDLVALFKALGGGWSET